MKKSFRLALESIYAAALLEVKVKAPAEAFTIHNDASATVVGVSEKVLAKVNKIEGVEVIRVGVMEATILIPAAEEYAANNPAFTTPEERAAIAAAKAERAANRVSKNKPELEIEEDDSEE